MRKGITPVVATIILLLVAIAISGLAYGFISGFFSGLTSEAIMLTGSTCTTGGVQLVVKNIGTTSFTPGTGDNIRITRGIVAGSGTPRQDMSDSMTFTPPGVPITSQDSVVISEPATDLCGVGNVCKYTIIIGGAVPLEAQITC